MMNSRASLRTTNFTGKPLSYQGVMFDGTSRVVFWGDFFEPFMFDAARQSLEWVIEGFAAIGILTRASIYRRPQPFSTF